MGHTMPLPLTSYGKPLPQNVNDAEHQLCLDANEKPEVAAQ